MPAPMQQMVPASEAKELRYGFVVIPSNIEDGGYSIIFPDLPGVSTWSPNLEEIASNVEEVLDLTFTGAEETGWLLPAPSLTSEDDLVRLDREQNPEPDPSGLSTAAEAGAELGITAQAVNLVARKSALGRKIGDQRLFTKADIDRMKSRPRPGKRPKKLSDPAPSGSGSGSGSPQRR